ncbi:penicillin-binding protein activator [Pelagibacterium limicola]|uniref:penicillin-binding protein activator n=1 Tax=Pelagibacterium limicola TaxID=2791022 RepID=UPI0018AF9E68|nr:penicillin-binding protein activator [Pelagibacterium limicola]
MPVPQAGSAGAQPLAPARGEIIGSGPVRVALILPLSRQDGTASAGRAVANGARLAMDFAARSGASHIHIVLKDTGNAESRARAAASEAVSEGASLILGPLRAGAVQAAGEVALAANIPMIGFSNTSIIARPGVYLLSVLPEAEAMRALSFARSQGRQTAAALVPANAYGEAFSAAFQSAARELGMPVRGVFSFGNEAQARQQIEQLVPKLLAGQIDTLFLPDRATAPSFGILLQAAQVPRGRITILGSGDWSGDSAIAAQAYLEGAFYPVIDPAGLAAIAPDYRARFGGAPQQLATIGFTAILLANTPALAQAAPRYNPQVLLSPTGFSGRDGPFRFHYDGRGEYGLVIHRVTAGGAQIADPARLGGITTQATGATSSGGNTIPPVGASLVQGSY